MKKIIFLLCLLLFARAQSFGQCSNCVPAIPLINHDFTLAAPYSYTFASFPCPIASQMAGYIGPYGVGYFSNANVPNWYRLYGAPTIATNNLGLLTVPEPGGGGFWCDKTGGQGVFANYPFLARGQYQVTLNFTSWENWCEIAGNATLNVYATSWLGEPASPSWIVEPVSASGISIGSWAPSTYVSDDYVSSQTFCAPVMPINETQLYINVSQKYDEFLPSDNDYAGEPAGFVAVISSVDISLCNMCPQDIYTISSPMSAEPVTGVHFGAGGLFVDAAINIEGSFFTNPVPSTLLWAKYITIDNSGIVGHAFQASIPQGGTFFEMLPNLKCSNPISKCSIGGTACVTVGGTASFTGIPAGGVFTSSDPSISINPTTGVATGVSLTPITGPGVTITYSYSDECISSISGVYCLASCKGGGRIASPSDTVLKTPVDQLNQTVNISPNPTKDNIIISYPCNSAGDLNINIRDVSGRLMYSEVVTCYTGNNVQHEVDLSSFSQGVYFVEITLNDQHTVKKIVKL